MFKSYSAWTCKKVNPDIPGCHRELAEGCSLNMQTVVRCRKLGDHR